MVARDAKGIFRSTRSLASFLMSVPVNEAEWKFAIKQMQGLLESCKYMECSLRIGRLLSEIRVQPHPTQIAALHFYAALSADLSAQDLHHLHPSKLQLLQSSREHYAAAYEALPGPEAITSMPLGVIEEEHSLDHALAVLTPSSSPGKRPQSIQPILRSQSSTSNQGLFSRSKSIIASLLASAPTATQSEASGNVIMPAGSEWLIKRTLQRYNNHLKDFADMLTKHKSDIDKLIQETEEAQKEPCSGMESANIGSSARNVEAVERPEKIDRLKKEGWARKRFDSKRYEELAEKALAELHCTQWRIPSWNSNRSISRT